MFLALINQQWEFRRIVGMGYLAFHWEARYLHNAIFAWIVSIGIGIVIGIGVGENFG